MVCIFEDQILVLININIFQVNLLTKCKTSFLKLIDHFKN